MPDIKELLQSLITDSSSKEQIEQVAVISSKVDEMIAEADKQKSDYTDLLKDYASLIKASTFKVDNQTKIDEGPKEVTFEGFLKNWEANNNK